MSVLQRNQNVHTSESTIIEFIAKEFGHFIVACDDRIFINVFRRTIVSELGLPSNSMTVVTNEGQIIKTIKELSVRKKNLLLFIQTVLNNVQLDEMIKQIAWKVQNCKVIIVTTESEVQKLALLREQKITDNWIIKPVVINQLLNKVASIIKPHGSLHKLILAAEEYLKQGAYRHVLTICRKIFEVHPDNPVAYMLMGDAYRGLEQEEEMVEAYEHACYVDQMLIEPITKLVDFYHERDNKEKEVQYLEKLDVMSPLNMPRKMEIAKLHLELGHGGDAKDTFENVMKLTNKRVLDELSETATKIGTIYAERGDPEAETYFRRAIEVYGNQLDKSHMHLFNNLGILLRKNGKWKEAVDEYKHALEIDPENEILHYNIAMAYDDGDDFSNACTSLNNALRINPAIYKNSAVVSYNIGMIFSKSGLKDEATRYLKHALALNPEHEGARTLLDAIAKGKT